MSIPASAYARRTPRQRERLAARYDREAKETIAASQARRAAEARAAMGARMIPLARRRIELLGVCLLTGMVTGRDGRRPFTREERAVARQAVKDAWGTLRLYEADFVTVLP